MVLDISTGLSSKFTKLSPTEGLEYSTLENLVYGTACNDQHFPSLLQPLLDLPNVAPSTPCLTETPVILEKLSSSENLWKMTIQTPRSPASHPFLNVFVAKTCVWCLFFFLTRHGFCFDGQKRNSTEICQHVQKISLCYKVYKRPLFSPDVNFAFNGQKKNGTQTKIYEWQKSWDMYSGSQRPQEMVLNICSAVWCILS